MVAHHDGEADKLGNRIPPDQRPRIEAVLAKEVPPVTAAEVTAFDLAHQEKIRAEYGECLGCYLSWPKGTEGVPLRPPSSEKPAPVTRESLEALGFKVPEPRGDGFIIGIGGPIRPKP